MLFAAMFVAVKRHLLIRVWRWQGLSILQDLSTKQRSHGIDSSRGIGAAVLSRAPFSATAKIKCHFKNHKH
jgi:hypothetical protein